MVAVVVMLGKCSCDGEVNPTRRSSSACNSDGGFLSANLVGTWRVEVKWARAFGELCHFTFTRALADRSHTERLTRDRQINWST